MHFKQWDGENFAKKCITEQIIKELNTYQCLLLLKITKDNILLKQSYIIGLLENKTQLFQNYMTWSTKQD
jgi:hypothetical protein